MKNNGNFKNYGGLRSRNIFKDEKNSTLVSILTVVKNGEKHLEETILSVLNQTYKNIEYIIIDGASTDSSLEIIKKYDDKLDYWISEKDQSLYDGFNKAIKLARGNLIGIINSDDIYLKEGIKTIVKYYENKKEIDFIFGSVQKHWGILHGYKPWKIFWNWEFYSSHSSGFFITKKASKIVGEYNINYKIHADYDYFYRMIVKQKLKGISTKKSELIGVFRRGGFSSTVPFYDHFAEETRIRIENKQNKLMVLLIFINKFLRNLDRL